MICSVVVTGAGSSSTSLLRGRLLVFVAIVMSALTLRLAVTSFSPLAEQIRAEIGFAPAVVGVFGMVPTAMFAAFGLLTPAIARRAGLEATALIAMLAAGVGMAARALTHETWTLLAFSALALAGMGVGNVVIPPLVKRYFSDRLAVVSTVYIVGVQIGTALPALAAVPVAEAAGWRWSIGLWAAWAFAAAIPWIVVLHRARGSKPVTRDAPSDPAPGRVWRSPVAWGMAGMFGMTSLITYSMFTWIPAVLLDAGGSEALGGAMTALFSFVGLAAAFVAPAACARMRDPFPLVLVCVVSYAVGFTGLLLAPLTATALWVLAIGVGPTTFPMALTLINLRTRTHAASAALSGFTQGLGYTVACAGPVLVGVLRETTGGWTVPFAFLGGAALVVLIAGRVACRPRYVEDSWGGSGAAPYPAPTRGDDLTETSCRR
ncbi:major facilitator superfamily cyanate symporter [Rhodococcus ruber BKS 20-38]|uniref:Major facilitator superfamily cyanate symporter n=1 Tax=Rhodococcus ruber BKS 20-38 TaxID=1278076 RepID=M2Y9L7_9NOCA|nr:MFS transporter [Rhodococcus ruber]EME51592.1 major facilitator superfamily cyanate symporter [Rhodococcus ruber BKS 20-38]